MNLMTQTLSNKCILVGVCGSIAAYKGGEVVRELRRAGAEVRVIMTTGAMEFVTPLTFQALSGHPVHRELLDEASEAGMGHIELARWADAILIAPASANFLARSAQGRADDLLSAVCLARTSPLAIAPAMNQKMWSNPITQNNLATLQKLGVTLIGPDTGDQACGETGPGRLLDPIDIVAKTSLLFQASSFSGKTVMITAGPTREAIDPVRFLSNHSSGKMGFALAQAVAEQGGKCILIAGPVTLPTPAKVTRFDVVSATQMQQMVMSHISGCDYFIGCAAVSDYRPATVALQKLKKSPQPLHIDLVANPDIISAVAKETSVYTIGFAAETEQLEQHAQKKRHQKNLDMIVANWVNRSDQGFNSDENAVSVYWSDGEEDFPLQSKTKLARQLIALIAKQAPKE